MCCVWLPSFNNNSNKNPFTAAPNESMSQKIKYTIVTALLLLKKLIIQITGYRPTGGGSDISRQDKKYWRNCTSASVKTDYPNYRKPY